MQIVHCGCIASKHLYEYMEFGGVACISCAKRLEINSAQPTQVIVYYSSKDVYLWINLLNLFKEMNNE